MSMAVAWTSDYLKGILFYKCLRENHCKNTSCLWFRREVSGLCNTSSPGWRLVTGDVVQSDLLVKNVMWLCCSPQLTQEASPCNYQRCPAASLLCVLSAQPLEPESPCRHQPYNTAGAQRPSSSPPADVHLYKLIAAPGHEGARL